MSIMSILASGGGGGRAALSVVYSANTQDASLNLSSISGYNAGNSDITVTVNSGIYVWASSISSPGLNITGGTTGDTLVLVNNGFIMGRGGDSYLTTSNTAYTPVQAGGTALSISLSATVNNTSGYIGGGGGGGGGVYDTAGPFATGGGGGAGGGTGCGQGDPAAPIPNSPGGSIGQSGANGGGAFNICGGGGGRILPGSRTTFSRTANNDSYTVASGLGGSAGGTGGVNINKGTATYTSVGGGPGESINASYTAYLASSYAVGGGGGWGASGGATATTSSNQTALPPGAGGKAVALNGKTITWTGGAASSSRAYGAVS